jgi:hypothetical protein
MPAEVDRGENHYRDTDDIDHSPDGPFVPEKKLDEFLVW